MAILALKLMKMIDNKIENMVLVVLTSLQDVRGFEVDGEEAGKVRG